MGDEPNKENMNENNPQEAAQATEKRWLPKALRDHPRRLTELQEAWENTGIRIKKRKPSSLCIYNGSSIISFLTLSSIVPSTEPTQPTASPTEQLSPINSCL